MKTILKSAVLLLVIAGCFSCGKNDDTDEIPPCIVDMIEEIKSTPVWNPSD
ncbi:MAG: hypothetical protein LBG18_00520 [Mediterranea sp.]|jgi:hypothetical protein|nr:hypothetical protein [Mediterranea sp.]